MSLKGEAKKNYQREYMRRRRSNILSGSNKKASGSNITSGLKPKGVKVGESAEGIKPCRHGLYFNCRTCNRAEE